MCILNEDKNWPISVLKKGQNYWGCMVTQFLLTYPGAHGKDLGGLNKSWVTPKKQEHLMWKITVFMWVRPPSSLIDFTRTHLVLDLLLCYLLYHDCVDFWCQTVVVAPDGGMCKVTTLIVKERCMTSQWRQVGDVARFDEDFECI